jgi:hypothetical protein
VRRSILCLAATAAALLTTPALAQGLLAAANTPAAHAAELNAQEAAINDDWSGVLADAARAYNLTPSVENEFNLAAAYENTGRPTLAIPLYRDVAARGRMTVGEAVYDYRRGPGPEYKWFFLSDAASNRLYALKGVAVRPRD